jgi:hypothetical protein
VAFFYGIYNALGQRVGVLLPGDDLRQQRWYLRPRALRNARIGWPFRFDRFEGGRVAAMQWAERDADDNAWSAPELVGQGRSAFKRVLAAYEVTHGETRQLDPGVVTFTGPTGRHVGSVFVAQSPDETGYLEAWTGTQAFLKGSIAEMRMEVVMESRDPHGAAKMGLLMGRIPQEWTTWLLHDR